MSIKRLRKAGEILTIWPVWLTYEKVGSDFQCHHGGARGSLSHSLSARLIPAYGFGVVRLSVEPNRFTFVQSRAQISVIFIGENEVRTASEIHYGRIDDA